MAVLAVLVVGVAGAGAGSAQAEPFVEADSYPATVTGAPLMSTVFWFHPGASPLAWECIGAPLQGELVAPSVSLLLTPSYSECRWMYPPGSPFSVVTMTMNGCKWRLHGLSKVEPGAYESLADLECPVGQEVSIELRELTVTICRMKLSSQANKSQVFLLDKLNEEIASDDSVEAFFNVEKLRYKMETPSGLCPVGSGTYEDLKYQGKESLTAKTKSGVQTGFRLSG
jgi:hypothetical protein